MADNGAGIKRARDAPDGTGAAGTVKKSAVAADKKLVPWRGSEVVLRNSFSGVSLDPANDLTYNPYYGMTWSFRPWWWFTKSFYLRAQLDVDQELTNSDITTYDNEALLGDLQLAAGFSNVVMIPKVKIGISFDLILTFPTSKASQARTMVMGIGPGMRVSRSFKVLKGLSVGYGVRVTPTIHRYSTGELDTPLIPGCSVSSGGCDSALNTGLRNQVVRLTHYADFSVKFLSWFGMSLSVGQAIDWLNPLGDSPEDVSLKQAEPDNQRYLTFFDLQFAFKPHKTFEVALGYSALHPQLAPNSRYYVPFFNRYSAVYLDLKLKIDGLVAAIKRSVR